MHPQTPDTTFQYALKVSAPGEIQMGSALAGNSYRRRGRKQSTPEYQKEKVPDTHALQAPKPKKGYEISVFHENVDAMIQATVDYVV